MERFESASSPCPGNSEELMVGGVIILALISSENQIQLTVCRHILEVILGFSFMSYLATGTSSMYG